MESFTAMSAEGVQAVKGAHAEGGAGYAITTAGSWTETHKTLFTALVDYQDMVCSLEHAVEAEDLVDELVATDSLTVTGDAFDMLVDALVVRWESHGDESAASILSGIAETLGIEFI